MQRNKRLLKHCGPITAIVILLSFSKPFPMFAEPPTEPPPILTESETRLYSGSEVDLLIGEISVAAYEAIEQAAGEAARAAFLASVEREAAALREAERWRLEAEANLLAIKAAKRKGVKNTILGVAIGILGGLALGVGGVLIIGGR